MKKSILSLTALAVISIFVASPEIYATDGQAMKQQKAEMKAKHRQEKAQMKERQKAEKQRLKEQKRQEKAQRKQAN